MDFMPYEEVRSALLVGKIIANEAVKCVQTLNFMKGCQLDGPSTRRFAGVEEVKSLDSRRRLQSRGAKDGGRDVDRLHVVSESDASVLTVARSTTRSARGSRQPHDQGHTKTFLPDLCRGRYVSSPEPVEAFFENLVGGRIALRSNARHLGEWPDAGRPQLLPGF